MEGASVALFCRSRNIPLIHIRAVSNYVSQTDSRLWDFGSAFAALRETVAGILDLTGAL
jgi:nucleoside phosphorylase